jgi:hypothetical protein
MGATHVINWVRHVQLLNIADIPSLQSCAYYWSIVMIATTIAIIENAALFALAPLGTATAP